MSTDDRQMSGVTPDVLSRFAAHWNRVNLLVCDHADELQMSPDGITCAKCDQPLKMMSEIQLEEVRRPESLERSSTMVEILVNAEETPSLWFVTGNSAVRLDDPAIDVLTEREIVIARALLQYALERLNRLEVGL